LPDGSFDVILSNLCLHNISARGERDAACREIVRLLKPGGVAVISDFRHTGQYAKVFQAAGLTVRRSYHPWDTFPPLTIVEARKPKLG
jgi:ubiquinone/menaquinone biosynthesis C-methylase UbiE